MKGIAYTKGGVEYLSSRIGLKDCWILNIGWGEWLCGHECWCPRMPKVLEPLELELQVVVSCPSCALGTELRYSVIIPVFLIYI